MSRKNMSDLGKYLNKKRMISTLLEFVSIYSPALKEKKLANNLVSKLKKLGCSVTVDNAHKKFGGEVGNIIAKLPGTGTAKNYKPILLNSHTDTVEPAKNVKPKIHNGKITSDGTTILGGDCKAGLTIVLEILHVLKEQKLPHPPVEILFDAAEEVGHLGLENIDSSKLRAKKGLVLDGDVAEVITRAPSRHLFDIAITGKTAHAGVNPEKGISAIEIAVKAVAKMKFGKIDHETVANIAVFKSENGLNVVAQEAHIKGELRSHNKQKVQKLINHMKNCLEKEVKATRKKVDGKWICAKFNFKTKKMYSSFKISDKNPFLKTIIKSAASQGVNLKTASINAGCGSNSLVKHGITAPLIDIGYRNAHTTSEYVSIKDFFNGAKVALAIVLNFKG
ncbi:MAG TPA: M20/M25/M40 family metallo-hydrolase [Elusimicrobiales bacterium]|nr:M20/M25/M40 family metallo-hydrolase [Elusimicrobiales bacterium]